VKVKNATGTLTGKERDFERNGRANYPQWEDTERRLGKGEIAFIQRKQRRREAGEVIRELDVSYFQWER